MPSPALRVPDKGTHLVLLGTVAGPVLHPTRMMTAQALVVDGAVYMFDCGYGAITRFAATNLRFADMRALFITHHHSDHNADYANLIHLAWIQGMTRKVDVIAPPPMQRIHVREITEGGLVFQDDLIKVRAVLVKHPPFQYAFGFRIDTADRSIVLSGDTSPCEALVELAKGADLLLHEAMYEPGIDSMLAQRPYVPPGLRSFLVDGHSSAQDCGHMATQAGVKKLALTHLLPSDDGLVSEDLWRSEAARHFAGEIIIGRDLMVL